MNSRIQSLRDRFIGERPSVDINRARIVTATHRQHLGEPLVSVWGKTMYRLFTELPIDIAPGELIVGSPTVKPRAAQLYPEVQAGWLDAELDIVAARAWDPLDIADEDKDELRRDILPFWQGRTIAERLFAQCPEDTANLIYLEPGVWPTRSTGLIDNYSLIQKGIGTVVPNYRKVLELGVRGILKQIDEHAAALDMTDTDSVPKALFYEAARMSLQGLVELAGRYAALALEKAHAETDETRRAELMRIHEVCSHVPYNPPRNFYEAVQAFWFTHLAVRIELSGHSLSPGRFDQYMIPYLTTEQDREEALELIESLFIKFSETMLFVNTDTSKFYTGVPQWQNFNLGGRTVEGRDATNELSYICIDAMIDVRIVQPDISVRIHPDSPEAFVLKACELSRVGTGHPKFYNEDLISFSMGCKGISLNEARDFAIMGCVEPRVQANEGTHLTGGFINLPAALELALNNGVWRRTGKQIGLPTGDARTFTRFEQLLAAYKAQLAHMIRHMFVVNAIAETAYSELLCSPFLSSLTEGCVESGRPLQKGGAVYNFGPAVNNIGIADTGDSLAAIKKLVFDEQRLTMNQVLTAIENDFEGHEDVRTMLLHDAPKYGNDDDYVDDITRAAAHISNDEVMKYYNIFGGQAQSGNVGVNSHMSFGTVVGALPSGRKATMPLADNSSPSQGNDRLGPTALARSVGKLDLAGFRNGTLLNLRLSPQSVVGPGGLRKMASFVRGLCDVGCWHAQFNLVDTCTLRDAQDKPEEYADLLVRVAGYSAYFTQLHRDVQEEIIRRTEHGL
ncbi:MAG: formate C-acetyltransferase/glycerol dehydratase family glycyl radical enzyme [Dehalococcoidia bacterium]|nr:formate C-acetyltransferase/glycerol dehydratase family glycyl radical enzyme [Dehalococcoidia bacterium]